MPAAVTGLHVTSTGTNSIGIAWNKSANATSYQVRVTYQSKVTSTAMTTSTSHTISGLTPNHTYGIHVIAINGSNWAPEASISQKTKS
jgi:Fibronectin type III domain